MRGEWLNVVILDGCGEDEASNLHPILQKDSAAKKDRKSVV